MTEESLTTGDVVAVTAQEELPLRGLRVLEVAPPSSGAVTRYLAELGADVILVPLEDLIDDPLIAFVANTGKRLLPLDLTQASNRSDLMNLAADADIFIHTRLNLRQDSAFDESEIELLRRRNPRLVIMSLTPFGKDNDYSRWQMTSSILDALSGVLSRSGFPDKAPLLPPAQISLECAYVQATWVIMLAYFNRLRTGKGDCIDLSLMDAAAQAMDPGYGIAGSAAAGVPASDLPRGRPDARHQYPYIPCKDGHVRICILAPRQWQGMFQWMGSPEKYAAPELNNVHVRFRTPTLLADIAALFATQTRAELQAKAGEFGVPIAAVLTLQEALKSEQSKARGSLATIDDATGRPVTVPNGIFEIDGDRTNVTSAAQTVGLDAGWLAAERYDPTPEAMPPERPLSGFLLIDFGVIVAGAEQSRLLADQGALTLKVETAAFPDGGRQSIEGGLVSVSFAMGHRNKKGLGLNLRDERGKALMIDLARKADIVMSNFKPGTLASLGLDYSVLSQVNPRIVMAESSAYGTTGPWSSRPGYGPLVRASSGLSAQWAYPDTAGEFSDAMTVYPDHVSGRFVAIATLALLVRRMRTARGGDASISQAEVIGGLLGDQMAALSIGEDRSFRLDAPWGAYPCAGDDEWCVVTVRNDADWRTLTRVIDRDDLLGDPALASTAGRITHRLELDRIIADWTRRRSPDEAMAMLQSAGIPAGKMLRVSELPEFGYYRQRSAYGYASHPLIAHPFKMEQSLARSEQIKDPDFAPAPVPGQHSEWIAAEILGLGEADIARLTESGVLEVAKAQA